MESATADHTSGLVTIELVSGIENRVLKKAVEEDDYRVLAIK